MWEMSADGVKVCGGIAIAGGKAEAQKEEQKQNTKVNKKEMTRTENRKNGDDDVSLRWGQCKRSRFVKACAVQPAQRSDMACSPDAIAADPLSHMQWKGDAAAEISAKGETENSCIDRQSPSLEKIGKGCASTEKITNSNWSSPHRNGQTRRRTELESLHGKPLMIGELSLAISKWPKFLISLSHKEKEDDFMAMKGSRLPQRPRKRAKHVERFVSYVSPGTWLCEMTLDRYEVREKKCIRKKPTGLKAMGSMDSDSE